jgi:hypothetical protein
MPNPFGRPRGVTRLNEAQIVELAHLRDGDPSTSRAEDADWRLATEGCSAMALARRQMAEWRDHPIFGWREYRITEAGRAHLAAIEAHRAKQAEKVKA